MPELTEAEIQLLIALIELAQPVETPNNNFYSFYPKTLDEAGMYFRRFREDWTTAYPSLAAKGLLDGGALTPAGVGAANRLRSERPPIYYFYRDYYTATEHSPAYADFCEQLYGANLCQTDFSDLQQVHWLAELSGLREGRHALDLGCGKGTLAEYLSNLSGARITGLDSMPEAIALAQARTASKRERLDFQVGNLDCLDLPPAQYDLIYAVNSLCMARDLSATLRAMARALKPGGKIAAFDFEIQFGEDARREDLEAGNTPLAQSFAQLGWRWQVTDFSAQTYRLMQHKRILAEAFKARLEAEGNAFLYEHIAMESESSPAPYDPEKVNMRRYLYLVEGSDQR